ncbi:MAG: tRNA pseudouridine(55) synthase TruB [Cyanobium sp.]
MQASPLPPAGPTPSACGFLVLDKPAGLTSHDCVARVRRAYGLRRVGHGGTLDPAVTGVLPIALGPATRLLPYLSGDKQYRGVIQLGVRTSSDDLEGEVLERLAVPALASDALEVALAPFRGAILQRPPAVSAVHVQGERAYVRVRRGEDPELPARPVTIRRLELLAWQAETGRLEIALECSAGTYVRSLARDLGLALGCGGALAQLRRIGALGFALDQAVSLEALQQEPPPPLLDPLAVLGHLPRRRLRAEDLFAWRCGRPLPEAALEDPAALLPATALPSLPSAAAALPASRRDPAAGVDVVAADAAAADAVVVVLTPEGRLAGIGRCDGQGWLRPSLVLEAAG